MASMSLMRISPSLQIKDKINSTCAATSTTVFFVKILMRVSVEVALQVDELKSNFS